MRSTLLAIVWPNLSPICAESRPPLHHHRSFCNSTMSSGGSTSGGGSGGKSGSSGGTSGSYLAPRPSPEIIVDKVASPLRRSDMVSQKLLQRMMPPPPSSWI